MYGKDKIMHGGFLNLRYGHGDELCLCTCFSVKKLVHMTKLGH